MANTVMAMATARGVKQPPDGTPHGRAGSIGGVAIGLAGVALAAVAAIQSIGVVFERSAPQVALALPFVSGKARASYADSLFAAQQAAAPNGQPTSFDPAIVRQARTAFRSEPTAAEAVRILAFEQAARGNQASARRTMALAEQLTRRDTAANMWLARDRALQGDLSGALLYYDRTLRTDDAAAQLLIPMTVKLLQNADMVEPMARMLAQNPPWARDFWNQAVNDNDALANAAALRMRFPPRQEALTDLDASLLRRLADTGQFDAAERLFRHLAPGRSAGSDLATGFTGAPVYPPFDWDLTSSGELGAGIAHGTLQISALSSAFGVAARRLVPLDAGTYRLFAEVSAPRPPKGEATLELQCATGDPAAPLATIDLANQTAAVVKLGPGCRFYWLQVRVNAPAGSGLDLTLTQAGLAPVRP